MKHLIILTIGICLLIAVPVMADQAADEAAILAAMERMFAAHRAHDAKAMVAEMDKAYETWEGDSAGLVAREEYWAEFYKKNKDFRPEVTDVIGVVFVTPGVAIWKGHVRSSGILGDDGKPMQPTKFLMASVLAKKNGKWLEIASFNRQIEE